MIVAFGDLTKFGTYAKLASRDPEDFEKFIKRVYEVFLKYKKRSEDHIKFLGDGLLMVSHFEDGHNCELVAKFLGSLCDLSKEMNAVVDEMRFPRPAGFRIRVASGHATKIHFGSGDPDYIGYPVNLAFKLLNINSEMPLLCHESVKDVLGKGDTPIKFEKVIPVPPFVDGVDQDDLTAIWSFRCTKK